MKFLEIDNVLEGMKYTLPYEFIEQNKYKDNIVILTKFDPNSHKRQILCFAFKSANNFLVYIISLNLRNYDYFINENSKNSSSIKYMCDRYNLYPGNSFKTKLDLIEEEPFASQEYIDYMKKK